MHHTGRATFDAGELAVVLSYYDIGVIESVTEFARGSRRNPKVGLVAEGGKFLLKRRSIERAGPERVRFVHRVQAHLVECGFPIAPLIPTRDRGHTFVELRDYVYELFRFIPGQKYAHTVEETHDAGAILARFHTAIEDVATPLTAPDLGGDYHDAQGVRTGLYAIGSTLKSHDSFSGDEAELATLVQALLAAYDQAAEAVARYASPDPPERLIHSDWHPGNLLFRNHKIRAVVDYDSMRFSRRVVDVANGALQFSMTAGDDPVNWPDHLDTDRYDAFLAGYQSQSAITEEERACIPHLMAEALIAECVGPIAVTGSMGRWAGFRFLQMVQRKLRWLDSHTEQLVRA